MPDIRVTPADGKKWQVLINFIRQGIPYSTQALAESKASMIRKEFETQYALANRNK